MADFVRLAWVSERARDVWEPRLEQISSAWHEMEWRSVSAGIRSCALTEVAADRLGDMSRNCLRDGLSVHPVGFSRETRARFSNVNESPRLGDPYTFRVVVGGTQALSAFADAWESRDDRTIGKMLGYPSCCYEFFKEIWTDLDLTDTTWPMVCKTGGNRTGETERVVQNQAETSIICRWIGVRAVPHLPCCCDCQRSIKLAGKFSKLGIRLNYEKEVSWAREIMSWPAEWSALHGLATIKLPIVKIIVPTDWTAERRQIHFASKTYPKEGASGISFPFLAR